MKSKEEIEQLAFLKYPRLINDNPLCRNPSDPMEDDNTYERKIWIGAYTQCQQDNADNFLSLIEEYREKELPNRNIAYHYEAEISSGLNFLIEFIKNKQD
jgi:hypothetical protein